MLPADFRSFIDGCAILPRKIKDHLIGKSEAITPDARERIVEKLRAAEAKHLQILEEGITSMLTMQKTMTSLLRDDSSTPFR
jgi:transcriptional regulator of NAD metabolism